ncbi:hypothetical protein F5X68DRAFT_6435 [Plectosphaerella plurivora]|uniref:F-box domain-containing protein n=1 Tax=Plectosphaerella plurivora TaxID=936078 RepID=A0A9P8VBK5_9PEZI|nr:hypothetical protein F5X68DRAFT_6435 [Plectosphaerella plurivora]
MGYSEIHCHICGVSFTIGRYRTLEEATTPDADLSEGDAEFLAQYLLNAQTSCTWECDNEDEGDCQVRIPPPRETWGNKNDQFQVRSNSLGHEDDPDSQDVDVDEDDEGDIEVDEEGSIEEDDVGDNEEEDDEVIEEEVDEDDEEEEEEHNDDEGEDDAEVCDMDDDDNDDDDFVDGSSELSEPHEYQSPDENAPEDVDSDVDMSDVDAPNEDTPVDPRLWQRAMDPTTKPGTIRPYITRRKHDRERDAQGLSEEDHRYDSRLEHIPGEKCTGKAGYCSSRISLAEMRGCTVAQALVSRPLDPGDWHSESDDESFEGDTDVGFFLTGLTDDPPSRDMNDPTFFPKRHGVTRVAANNYAADSDWNSSAEEARDAVPFHPTCLEVFKRASLWRTGRVDIKGLVDWFKIEASWDKSNDSVPRSGAVRRGYEQWWLHVKGDEHIVANPCYVPHWDKAIATGAVVAKTGGGALQGVFELGDKVGADVAKDRFACFDHDIRLRILRHLVPDPKDIANLRLASRAFRQLPRVLFLDLILHRRPWLWEAWCDLPYSRWTSKGEKTLRRMDEAWRAREEILQHSIQVLQEDANDTSDNTAAIEALMAKVGEIQAERRDACADIPVPLLPSDTTDWFTTWKWLARAKPKWPKGLRNRRRIWVDCGYILDRIEANRREGKIAALKETEGVKA